MSNTSLLIQRWIMCCKAFSHFSNRELATSGAWGGLSLPHSHSSCSILIPMTPWIFTGLIPGWGSPQHDGNPFRDPHSWVPEHKHDAQPSIFLRAVQQGTKHQEKCRCQKFPRSGGFFCSAQCPLGFLFLRGVLGRGVS